MQSRESLHQTKQVSQPARHHRLFNFIGIILLTIFLLASVANQTVMNEKFVAKQIAKSDIGTEIVTDVNNSASQYGLDEKIMTKKIANELIEDAVGDVYADREISIDFTPVYNRVDKLVNDKLSDVGYSGTGLSSSLKSELQSGLNSIINQQMNTSELTNLEGELASAKTILSVLWAGSGILLVIMAIYALIRRFLLQGLGWISLIGGVFSLLFLKVATVTGSDILSSQSSLSSLSPDLPNSIFGTGLVYGLGFIIVGAVLLVVSRLFKK